VSVFLLKSFLPFSVFVVGSIGASMPPRVEGVGRRKVNVW
jgi:hypothetical protein